MTDNRFAEPKLGDLIEISRTGYQHWAIYVGSGYVIHLGPLDECCPSVASPIMSGKAVVKKELLWNVLGSDQYRVNNKYDRKYQPLPANKIVQEAESLLGVKLRYNLASNNCEHFVTRLRYGKPRSDQVGGVLASKVGLVGMGVVALLAIVVNSFLLPRKHGEK